MLVVGGVLVLSTAVMFMVVRLRTGDAPESVPEEAVDDWINPRNNNPSKLLPLALTDMNFEIADSGAKEGL